MNIKFWLNSIGKSKVQHLREPSKFCPIYKPKIISPVATRCILIVRKLREKILTGSYSTVCKASALLEMQSGEETDKEK